MPDELSWTRKVPLLNNYYMVMDVLFVILLGGAGLGALLVLFMGAGEIYAILEIITLATGAFIVLVFIAMGVIMMNDVELTFTLTDEGVKTVLGGTEDWLNKVILLLGYLAKLGLMGSPIILTRKLTSILWGDIQKAVMDERKKVISLSSERRLLVRMFCDPETYLDTVAYVERMLPEIEPKHL